MARLDGIGAALLPERWLGVMHGAPRLNIRLERGEGAYVWDDEGERYLDLVTGGGAVVLGYGHARFTAALSSQLKSLGGANPDVDFDVRDEFLEALSVMVPMPLSSVVLGNSGSEAVEAAVRIAFTATGRRRIVVMHGAGHGALYLTSLLSDSDRRSHVRADGIEITRVPFNDASAAAQALDRRTAALLVEPVQWSGGVRVAQPGYLNQLQALCRAAGALLIVDEVMTALRTWPPLLSTVAGIEPDLVCLGPSIGNGFPVGATVMTGAVAERAKRHTSLTTTAGNPLASAAAAATLRSVAEPTMRIRVAESGNHLQARLRALRMSEIKEVRGVGVMAGVELHSGAQAVVRELRGAGVLAAITGSRLITLLPPLIIERRQIDHVVERLAIAIREVRQTRRRRKGAEPDVELRGVAARSADRRRQRTAPEQAS
jgi:LysW-gamma-L-lysine/LysW-L-ornithine aminotransferase